MSLVKWEPIRLELQPFRSLRDEVDRVFENHLRQWYGPTPGWPAMHAGAGGFTPNVDLREEDEQYILRVELPGFTKDDIDVTMTEEALTLKGEREEEKEQKKSDYHYRETSFGAFHRVIPVPGEIAAENLKAELKDSILTLTLPKAQPSKRRRITIKVE